jgi:hypothetical protein
MHANRLQEMLESFKEPMGIEILDGQSPDTSIGQLCLFYHLFSKGQNEDSPPLFGNCIIDDVIYPMWLHTYRGFHGRFARRGIVQFTGDSYVRGQSCYIIKDNRVWYKGGNCYYSRGQFIDFMSEYVSDLGQGRYDITEGTISAFPNYGMGVTEQSENVGITCTVSTIPLPAENGLFGRRTRIIVAPQILQLYTNPVIEFSFSNQNASMPLHSVNDYYDTCRAGTAPVVSHIRDNHTVIFTIQAPNIHLETPASRSP